MATTNPWILNMVREEVHDAVDLEVMKDYIAVMNAEYNMDIDIKAVDALSMDDVHRIQNS